MSHAVETVMVDNQWAFERPADWPDFPVVFGVTQARGGFSEGDFQGLNMALHIGDDPAKVLKNRDMVAKWLGASTKACSCGDQTHELFVKAVTAENQGAGALSKDTAFPHTDALMTAEVQSPLFLFIADCVPVFLYDAKRRVIAVIHAGWRGVIGRLMTKTLAAMTETYGTEVADCYAYVGPSIHVQSFEVSEELAAQFAAAYDDSVVQRFVRTGATEATPHVDLQRCLFLDWMAAGGKESQLTISPTDSMTSDSCFSYRRDQGKTGRMALFAMITDSNKGNV